MDEVQLNPRPRKLLGTLLRVAVMSTTAFVLVAPAQAQTVTATVPAGSNPQSIAVNPITNKMYVANINSNTVTVIDGATNTTTTVPVGTRPASVAINTVTNMVYVATSSGGGSVAIIDGATDAVITTVTTGSNPGGTLATGPVAVNPVTNKIYAILGFANMTVIDGATNTATDVRLGDTAFGVAVNPATNKIYVTFGVSPGGVSVFDGTNNALLNTLCCFSLPAAVGVNPVTNKVYVTSIGSSTLTVINGANDTITTTLGVGGTPFSLAVNPVTNRVYVANSGGTVTVLNGATNAIAATVAAGAGARNLAVNPTTNKVYVANPGSNDVTIIDGATNTTTTVAAGSSPFAVGVNPVTNKVYVTNQVSNDVTVIDGATYTTATVATGTTPFHVALNPVTNKIYVANQSVNTLAIIDGATNTTNSVQVGSGPSFVAVNSVTNKIYVANQFSSNVTVIDGVTNSTTTVATGFKPSCLAVNPLTNRIYVATQDNVAVIDGVTNTVTPIAPGVPTQTIAINTIAINLVTNRIYVSNSNASNTVTVIDGLTNSTTTVPTGTLPLSVAVNPVTNKIYVNNFGSDDVTVIDGATNSTTTVPLPAGSLSRSLAVNPLTNLIYVVNGNNTTTVIDGATNATTTFAGGSVAVAVNTATNKIYAVQLGGAVTVIDGLTNATTIVAAGSLPRGVAVNPITNKAYVVNSGFSSNSVTVITEQNAQAIPLTTTISPLPNDQTTNPTPSFTFTASSTFAPTAPPVNAVYFQVDTWQGEWMRAVPAGAPGSFTGTVPALAPGAHTIYAFATDGQDATSIQGKGQSSPLIGRIAAYHFLATTPLTISIDNVTVTKPASGTVDATFTVSLSASSAQTVTVDFTTSDDSARAGIDYNGTSGTLTFAPGEFSKSIVVQVLGGTPNALPKYFFVDLSNATNATIGSAQGLATIMSLSGAADLSISAFGSPDPIDTGQLLRYGVNVSNNGSADATGVTVTYAMPSGAVFNSITTISGGVGCITPAVGASGTVTCDFTTLAAGATKDVNIFVKPQTPGTLSAPFSVKANETDSDTTNNSITVTTTVNLAPPAIPAGPTQRVSVASDGTQANSGSSSFRTAISADGRFIAFESTANNLAPGDTNALSDVFVRDTCANAPAGCTPSTTRVSVASDGTEANGRSRNAVISADGRFIAFQSDASNLAPGDTNNTDDAFVRDTCFAAPAGCIPSTTRVSVATDGTQGNNLSSPWAISANGQFVAFQTRASNLVPGDTNGGDDILVRDTVAGTTVRVSVASDGSQSIGGGTVFGAAISANGRFVAFLSNATNLVPGDTNGKFDVFVRDTCNGAPAGCAPSTFRADVANDGTQANGGSQNAAISADGRFIAFDGGDNYLVPGDTNGVSDVFIRDTCFGAPAGCTPSTSLVSLASDGTQANSGSTPSAISADGRFVVFHSVATNLVPGDTNGTFDVFVRDTCFGAPAGCTPSTSRESVASDGAQGNFRSFNGGINGDGRFVTFLSDANNLVPWDTNVAPDVFRHDRGPIAASITADLSISASGAPDPIDTGQVLRYVVNVTNNGPADATGVTVTYVMPSGAVFDSVSTRSGGVGCTVPAVGSTGTVTCDFTNMATGTTKGLSIFVKPQNAGTLSALFSVAATETDPDTTNNSSTATVTVNLATVVINVTENIVVTDTPFVLPSAMIGVAENIVVTDAPSVLPSAMIGVAENIVVTDAPGVQPSAMIGVNETITVTDIAQIFDTVAGTNILVNPVDPGTNTSPVSLTFSSVLQPGSTSLTSSSSGPPAPSGFAVGSPTVYYDLTTTAQFSGNILVCISYANITFKGKPALFHYEKGVWVDVTVSVDTINQIVCGSVKSLSPFALFEPTFTYGINLLYDPSKSKKSGSTFPIKIQIVDASGNNRSSSQIVVTAVRVVRVSDDSSAPLEDSGEANADFNFRYDPTLGGTGGYIFNLSSKGFPSGGYRLVFTVAGDPIEHFAPFQVK